MKKTSEVERKTQHIELALKSQISQSDSRFYYEPVINCNFDNVDTKINFSGYDFDAPIWVSSMTGGTADANKINTILAKACKKYNLGMGLGSCRSLLKSDEFLDDFNLRKIAGDDTIIYANLGIAQVEQLLISNKLNKINEIINKTETNGLIIHINPLQEWLQPEGDKISKPPFDTISEIISKTNLNIIVKEVGQGMGPKSIEKLMRLPLKAIEFGALGGTNFSKIELARNENLISEEYTGVTKLGHSALEMIDFINQILHLEKEKILCNNFIISGGVKGFLDGYYFTSKINANAIYAHASGFLQYALKDFDSLCNYIETQIAGLKMAKTLLVPKV